MSQQYCPSAALPFLKFHGQMLASTQDTVFQCAEKTGLIWFVSGVKHNERSGGAFLGELDP